MAGAARARRVADHIYEAVVRLLQGRVKDPRLSFVTVIGVRVTGDLQQATVFYTVCDSDEEQEKTIKTLCLAKGPTRSEVGKAFDICLTPSLPFQLDVLSTTVKTLEDVLAQTRAYDVQTAKVAEGATYADDANPYRHDKEDKEVEDDDPQAEETDQEPVADAGDL